MAAISAHLLHETISPLVNDDLSKTLFSSFSGYEFKVNHHYSGKYHAQQAAFHNLPASLCLKTSIHPSNVLKHIPVALQSLITELKISPGVILGELKSDTRFVTSTVDDLNGLPKKVNHKSKLEFKRATSMSNIVGMEAVIPEAYLTSPKSRCEVLETEKELNGKALDTMEVKELLDGMIETYHTLASILLPHLDSILKLITVTKQVIQNGGRIFILGAGTSGRLAAECSSYKPSSIIAIPAGGKDAIFKCQKGAEDQYTAAWLALEEYQPNNKDIIVGLSASGSSPFVLGGLCISQSLGFKTASISCNKDSKIMKFADLSVEVPVGAEFITGSTRMKSGSAQLFILSLIALNIDNEEFNDLNSLQCLLTLLEQQTLRSKLFNTEMEKLILFGANALKNNGKIVYIGNDACGRLGIIDASECPPTFGVEELTVTGLIPDGDMTFKSAFNTTENVGLTEQLQKMKLNSTDLVVIISSSFHAQLKYDEISTCCDNSGATLSMIRVVEKQDDLASSTTNSVTLTLQISSRADREIITKMVIKQTLNMFTTAAMIRDGRVRGNRMAYMQRSNLKLQKREVQNLKSLSGLTSHQCGLLLSLFSNTAEAEERYLDAVKQHRQSL
ncbi:N-acetylmuramic acid 6-phosphate etherase [Parashewanella spongiae]|uniref:N-acetylmuramic acid 6-phosphate etherase n=1 Tax=Parashewanella spongiae TaxID=342950 RepID=A0A3A6TAA8_9GAMM|nr:N-acetylmuramic acid 6-phosphate etherase [Parashewanella spongiae]MCL1080109.1 N-acetylmuramic acid 6-phosphate etherase [Parashewanella spongiae]RJY04927.1 N-acetylmuramic acid 6-phosphate etherase [Parashewanella spongiae]